MAQWGTHNIQVPKENTIKENLYEFIEDCLHNWESYLDLVLELEKYRNPKSARKLFGVFIAGIDS